MRIELTEVGLFKSVFKNIGLLSDGVDFVFDEEQGLKIAMLDKSHVIYYSCHFMKSFFVDYEYTDDNQGVYSLDSTELGKVLRKCGGDELIMEFYNDSSKCVIRNGTKTFTLTLLDVEANNNPAPPNLPYVYSVDVPYKYIKESLKDCDMYGNKVSFNTKGHSLYLTGEGMMGKYSNEYTSDKELETTNSTYGIEKIMTILGADKISDRIIVKGGKDMPLILEITNVAEDVKLEGLVAPVIGEVE